jgi:hypothetical protein
MCKVLSLVAGCYLLSLGFQNGQLDGRAYIVHHCLSSFMCGLVQSVEPKDSVSLFLSLSELRVPLGIGPQNTIRTYGFTRAGNCRELGLVILCQLGVFKCQRLRWPHERPIVHNCMHKYVENAAAAALAATKQHSGF